MHEQSFLGFIFNAMGTRYTILLPFVTLIAFAYVLALLIRGRGPFAAAGLILAVNVPFLVGILGTIDGIVASYSVITVGVSEPKLQELAHANLISVVTSLVGLMLSGPLYVTAMIGSAVRAFLDGAKAS